MHFSWQNPFTRASIFDIINVKNIPNLYNWLITLTPKAKEHLAHNVRYSHYLQQAHEEDARFGGILFTSLLLTEYKRALQYSSDASLLEYINQVEAFNQDYFLQSHNDQSGYKHYNNFKQIFKDISYDSIVYLKQAKANSNNIQANIFYSSLLKAYSEKFIEKASNQELEAIYFANLTRPSSKNLPNNLRTHVYNLNKEIYVELMLRKNEVERADFANNICSKFINDYKHYTFGEEDLLLSTLYINGLISSDNMQHLVGALVVDKRYIEAYSLLGRQRDLNFNDNNKKRRALNCLASRIEIMTSCTSDENMLQNASYGDYMDIQSYLAELYGDVMQCKEQLTKKDLRAFPEIKNFKIEKFSSFFDRLETQKTKFYNQPIRSNG